MRVSNRIIPPSHVWVQVRQSSAVRAPGDAQAEAHRALEASAKGPAEFLVYLYAFVCVCVFICACCSCLFCLKAWPSERRTDVLECRSPVESIRRVTVPHRGGSEKGSYQQISLSHGKGESYQTNKLSHV